MNILQKAYWKSKNQLEAALIQALRKPHHPTTGLLSHRKDPRDHEHLGGAFSRVSPQNESVSLTKDWRFNQAYFNICVFASNVMGSSYQENKRFSVKFAVQMARKQGHITGNGFSYLRAALDIAVDYGRLPYEMMPDEVNGLSWDEYSKYQITDEMLAEAEKWQAPSYKKVGNLADAVELLDNGIVLFTGVKWYSAMNNPQPPNYYLNFTGNLVGGHAIDVAGYRAPAKKFQDFENPNTFGSTFADGGVDRIRNIFASGFFDVYYLEPINS